MTRASVGSGAVGSAPAILLVLAESLRGARARPGAATLTALLVAALVAGVMGLLGDAASAEERVLKGIDDAGTRTIVVRAQRDQPLPTSILSALAATREVQDSAGFGPVVDAYPAAFDGGPAVGVRWVHEQPSLFPAIPLADHGVTGAWSTGDAAEQAGLRDGVGVLRTSSGVQIEVVGAADLPEYLVFLEPVVLVPATPGDHHPPAPLTLVAIVADQPWHVQAVESMVRALLADSGVDRATVETSAALAEIRATVSGELEVYRRSVLGAALGLGGALTFTAVLASTMVQRREFGRRRALGASRSLVAALVVAHATLPAIGGGLLGIGLGLLRGVWLGLPPPPSTFLAALVCSAVSTVIVASLVPAVIASRRDPLTELRVP